MSVVGIGIDVVAVRRLEDMLARHGGRFLARCFRSFDEQPGGDHGGKSSDPVAVAVRWAAKEAFLKALGADVRGIPYRDIEIVFSGSGMANILPHGKARAALERTGAGHIHLSMSHEAGIAVASVILES